EVWSLLLTMDMHSPLDVLRVHHDNNHVLNTLWLYAMGLGQAEWVYRLPSLLAGTAGIVLAGVIAAEQAASDASATHRRWRSAVIGSLLFGGSYMMVHYSSEAR